MHAVWPILVALVTGPSGDRPAVARDSRVRAAANARALLADAAAHSPTVRTLIGRLDASDVIVYIEVTPSPQIPRARTKLVAATPAARFVRIGVRNTVPPSDVMPLLAHELQHAVEIAEQPDVRDDDGVRRLFARIGHLHGTDRYETEAARNVERQTRAEMRARIPYP